MAIVEGLRFVKDLDSDVTEDIFDKKGDGDVAKVRKS